MKKTKYFINLCISLLISICIMNIATAQKVKQKRHKAHVTQKKHVAHKHNNSHSRPYKYAQNPKCGVIINARPAHGKVIPHHGVSYHFHNGIWYKPHKGKFVVFRPFRGIRIKVLPPNCYRFNLKTKTYNYYYGTYYVHLPDSDEYEITDPPIGAKVDELPNDYTEQVIDGKTYYILDDVSYIYLDDEKLFEVVLM